MAEVFSNPIMTGAVCTSVAIIGFFNYTTVNTHPTNPEINPYKSIYTEYSNNTTSLINEEFKITSFDILKKLYTIDSESKTYINAFGYALKDLKTLNNLIVDTFGNVSVKLEPFQVNKEAGLLIRIAGTGDVLEDMNKLKVVCEEWFANTELEVSKNIYIDVMV